MDNLIIYLTIAEGGGLLPFSEICSRCPFIPPRTLHRALSRMVEAGALSKKGRGVYLLNKSSEFYGNLKKGAKNA